jgi:hypothetical protein
VIDPRSFDPVCVQRRVKVPEYAPLYFPDHFPARRELEELTAATAAVTLKIARRAATIRGTSTTRPCRRG